MKKSFLIFIIFISFFYLSSQNANALDYKCDSRPNGYGSLCSECAGPCDYTNTYGSCSPSNCPSGKVLVDCNIVNYDSSGFATYDVNCMNLQCGDAGVASGNICSQQSSLDSSCVDVASKTYGWTDNTALLSCTCYDTTSATINQYTKKADGTTCTYSGQPSTCKSGVCQPLEPACLDGTPEGSCCTTPGQKCKKDASNNLVCQADSTCVGCAASSSYTSQPACSGAVSGTGASCGYYWCASPNTPSNTCVQSSADCAPPLTTSCSAYNSDAGNCNSAGGCYYCAIYGTCLSTTDTSCPGYVDCSSYTSQSACTTDGGSSGSPKPACGWCPNSYNSGTSANGGTCYAASVLASKCDSCFITGTYNTWTSGYCRDACPYAAPANGYVSGWCTMSNIMSGGTVNCAGNKFDVTKNNNGAVDCGECAINANNKDCGGTAVTNNVYSDTFLGYIYYNGVLSPGTVYYAKKTGTSLDSGVCPVSTASQPFGTLDACKTYYSGTNFVNETSPGFYGGVVCGSSYEGQTLSCYKRTGGYEGQYNPAECSNGIDNNRDCLIDCADPNCDFSLKFLDELFKPAA